MTWTQHIPASMIVYSISEYSISITFYVIWAGFTILANISFINELKDTISKCSDFSDDLQKLETYAEQFTDLGELFKTIVSQVTSNFSTIYSDVTAAINDYNSENWETFGKDLAELLFSIVPPTSEAFEFLQN